MEYDRDDKQSNKDIRTGSNFTIMLTALFVLTGILFGTR